MQKPFSDISGLPAQDEIKTMDISYSLPFLNDARFQVVARITFGVARDGIIDQSKKPDLTREDVIELLRGLFERFRDSGIRG